MLDSLIKSTVDTTLLDSVMEMKPAPRVEKIREAFFDLEHRYSIERARIETRVLKETEGEPIITRRAKVFAAVVREIPIDIYPDELIVGCTGVGPCCTNASPMTVGYPKRRKGGQPYAPPGLNDEDLRELNEELTPYWKQQGRVGKWWSYGHNIHGMKTVLKKGFVGLRKDVEDRLAQLDTTRPEDLQKIPFLEGVALAMEAAAEFGGRFAARARELAGKEGDIRRKSELLKIAEICEWVPANPPRTFYEALQSYHFSWVMLTHELSINVAFALGRMDQYLYPYYERDLSEDRITREEAQELLDCYILKLNYVGNTAQSSSGSIGIGGLKSDGNDATNDLTYMFIEAMMHTRLVDPWFALHVHSKTPEDLLIKACQLTSLGSGHPQYINSDVGVALTMARGRTGGTPYSLADARDASNVGCLEFAVPGKDAGYIYVAGHNLALAVELALNNGVRRVDGRKMGAETGDPRRFQSFEDVQDAVHKQIAFIREKTQRAGTIIERSLIEFMPTVYESALIEGCIEKGLSKEEGGSIYDFNMGVFAHGSSDAGDALAAVKRLVFDEEKVSMADMCDALSCNFEGHEEIRKMCLGVPKFGNDDDDADAQVAWVIRQWTSEARKLRNLRGTNGSPGGSPMSAYIPEGKIVGALPSGRLAGEPLAPAACPSTGKELKGPTAVLKSMGKVDGTEVAGGLSLTTRIDTTVFEDRDGVKRLADLIRTFVDQKVFHLQINVISSETLKAAQVRPEEYRDLTVKVAGYNAYFTKLSKELQDTIIARTAHGL